MDVMFQSVKRRQVPAAKCHMTDSLLLAVDEEALVGSVFSADDAKDER